MVGAMVWWIVPELTELGLGASIPFNPGTSIPPLSTTQRDHTRELGTTHRYHTPELGTTHRYHMPTLSMAHYSTMLDASTSTTSNVSTGQRVGRA
eukprot:3941290-Rhodomonas_salina.2